MPTLNSEGADGRVLLLAPTGRDATLISGVLGAEGVSAEACGDIEEFCRKLSDGAGAAFITEEALTPFALQYLVEALRGQPQWSDFPIVLLTRGGESGPVNPAVLKALGEDGNVTLVERPTHVITLMSALRAALRARRRQYEMRAHL
ncbi:MAG: Hybrid sensor histidine kinase, partial [Acidobacteria bacterium]|nr:Hybrid sensor histidine kinase [Acidobacteriota bacterium]